MSLASRPADLITHPARARILTALMGRRLTTPQIAQLVPEVPLPSLYRHLRLLVEGGVVAPVEEIRVNGAATKVYAVERGRTLVRPDEADPADRLQHLLTFLNTLAATYRAYLERAPLDPAQDPVHCLMQPLHLTPDEYGRFMDEFNAFLAPWRGYAPAPDRRRVLFAHLALPDQDDPPLD